MQNSQRVLLAKLRTAPMARRRDGDIAPYRNGTAPRDAGEVRVRVLRDAKPRTAVASRHGQWRGGASREGGEPPRAVAAAVEDWRNGKNDYNLLKMQSL